ncbi:MAG: hypothetical protein ACI4VW_06490 [Acutalibacteraceae bacterium]
MPEKYKLGLTRNRLFEFDNCVSFLGEAREKFDYDRCIKALKTLCLKEPLLCCGAELCENGDAYIVEGKNEIDFEFFQGDLGEYVRKKEREGFDFSKPLFSLAVINGNVLGVFAHTLVADVRSLIYIAGAFMDIYESGSLSVVPSEIKVISETSQLPSGVFSVVIDRLSSGLEMGWQKNEKIFSVHDYIGAREKYLSKKKETKTLVIDIDSQTLFALKDFAAREKVDVSSLVAFAFHESLTKKLGGRKKFKKLNIHVNERAFLEGFEKAYMGAFNGVITVSKKKDKELPNTVQNNGVSFHKNIYKNFTSVFKVFYNEFLLMRVPGSYCDSQYMYCAGVFPRKCSKKLAKTYGCANEVAGEFCSCNLNQDFWSNQKAFKEVYVQEPLKMRSATMITFVEKGDSGKVYFTYKEERVPHEAARSITQKAVELLKTFK